MTSTPPPAAPVADTPAVPFRPDDDDGPVAFPDVPQPVTAPADGIGRPARMRRSSKPDVMVPPPAQVLAAVPAAREGSPAPRPAPTIERPPPTAPEGCLTTACVVKNIAFALKREQLIAIIDQLGLPQPYALNYHFENGAFRGLAFANFRTPEETDAFVHGLHGYMALGREIRVEYKKVLPAEEAARKEAQRRASILALDDRVPEFDLSDSATRALYEKMVHFRDDATRFELIFAKTITGPERKLVRAIGQRLGFFYRTEDNGEERFFKVARKPAPALALKDKMPRKYSLAGAPPPSLLGASGAVGAPGNPGVTPTLGTGIPAGLAIPDHRVPAAVATLRAAEAGAARLRAYSMGQQDVFLGTGPGARSAALRKNSMLSGAPPPGFMSNLGPSPMGSGAPAPAGPQAAPASLLRQPKGPDANGATGLAHRKGSLNPGAPPFNVQEVQAAVAAASAQKKALEIVDPAKSANEASS